MNRELLRQFEYESERWIFRAGLQQYPEARRTAQLCSRFVPDDEDEQVDDEVRSCYNCQYRRWVVTSFECVMFKSALLLVY